LRPLRQPAGPGAQRERAPGDGREPDDLLGDRAVPRELRDDRQAGRRPRARRGQGGAAAPARHLHRHAGVHRGGQGRRQHLRLPGGGRRAADRPRPHDVPPLGRRRAPLLPHLDHQAAAELPDGADQRGEGDLVAQLPAALEPFDGEVGEPLQELRVRDARRLEEARVDARRGESRDRVQLVDEHLAVVPDEHVCARHAFAIGGDEGPDRELLGARDLLLPDARGHDEVHLALVVLRLEVVPLVVGDDDLARQRRGRRQVSEHAHLDLDPRDEPLDEHLLVVLEGERDRGLQLVVVVRLRDADARAEPCGLDEHRVPERVARLGAEAEGDVLRHRDPLVAEHALEDVLVHAERRGEHAGADVRDPGELEQPLHRPVLAERPVQHRKDDIDAGELRRDLLPRQPLSRNESLRTAGAELPPPLAVDLDREDVVAGRLERRDDARRGGARDRVLARAAAEDHGDPPGHGVVVVVVVPGAGCWSWPTWIVTTSPPFASVPAGGSCESTMPSWLGSVTGSYTTATEKLEPRRIDSAADCVCVVTSGTCVVAGPFETDSVIFVPLDTWLPGGGSELTTTPGARSDWMSTRETTKPWPSSADFAFAYGCPVTSGTGIGLAPRETLMRT